MPKYINADALQQKMTQLRLEQSGDMDKINLIWQVQDMILQAPTADVREVIEADGYKHLICPHCLSEFYAKTKAEMFCPDCGKKFFFSEKWGDYPYVGENIEAGNGLP